MRKIIEIYTDGSAGPTNPGPGGFGVVIVEDDVLSGIYAEEFEQTTNNRMEMQAILYAYKNYGVEQGVGTKYPVVYSDSSYCVNTFNDWIFGLRTRGLKKANNQTPENMDLLLEFMELFDKGLRIDLRKIKGHAGHKYNELADKLAKREIVFHCDIGHDNIRIKQHDVKSVQIKVKEEEE